MTKRKTQSSPLPETNDLGWIPTNNRHGFNSTDIDDLTKQFLKEAKKRNSRVLDIGCSWGMQSLAALEKGAKVVAVDIGETELAGLRALCPAKFKRRLKTVHGQFAAVDLPPRKFDAILSRLSLHFSDGPTLDHNISKMFDLLKPGGKVFIMTTTPYALRLPLMRREYEKRKAAGVQWPGYFADMEDHRTDKEKDFLSGFVKVGDDWAVVWVSNPLSKTFSGPMHFIEPEMLAKAFERRGFTVEKTEYYPGANAKVDRRRPVNGKEFASVIASKPK